MFWEVYGRTEIIWFGEDLGQICGYLEFIEMKSKGWDWDRLRGIGCRVGVRLRLVGTGIRGDYYLKWFVAVQIKGLSKENRLFWCSEIKRYR